MDDIISLLSRPTTPLPELASLPLHAPPSGVPGAGIELSQRISRFRCQAVPFYGLDRILLHVLTMDVQVSEVELGPGKPQISRLTILLGRFHRLRFDSVAGGAAVADLILGTGAGS